MNTYPEATTSDQRAYVPVMVPDDLVPEVLRLIADRLEPNTEHNVEAPNAAEATNSIWPVEKLAKFSASRVKTVVIVSEVLDYLAERPDQPVPTSELSAATGHSPTGLRAAWVKLGRHLEKHYGDPSWPLKSERGPSMDFPLKETYYWISGEQAKRWMQVRGQEGTTEQGNETWDEAQRRAGRA